MELSFFIENYLTDKELLNNLLHEDNQVSAEKMIRSIKTKMMIDLFGLWIKSKFPKGPTKPKILQFYRNPTNISNTLSAARIGGFAFLAENFLYEDDAPEVKKKEARDKNAGTIFLNRVVALISKTGLMVEKKDAISYLLERKEQYFIKTSNEPEVATLINGVIKEVFTSSKLSEIIGPPIKGFEGQVYIATIVNNIDTLFHQRLKEGKLKTKSSALKPSQDVKEDAFFVFLKEKFADIVGEPGTLIQHPNGKSGFPDYKFIGNSGKEYNIDSKGEKLKTGQKEISIIFEKGPSILKKVLIDGYNGTKIHLTTSQLKEIMAFFGMELFLYTKPSGKEEKDKDVLYRIALPESNGIHAIVGTSRIQNIQAFRSVETRATGPAYWFTADFPENKGAKNKTLFRLEFRGNLQEYMKNNP